MRKFLLEIVVMTLMLGYEGASSQTRERSQIPVKYTWDLTPIYASDEAWQAAKTELVHLFDGILAYQGQLGQSAEQLFKCLDLNSQIGKELNRLRSYAAMKYDLDTRDAHYIAMRQEIGQLATEYHSKAAFIEPEILQIPPEKLKKFIKDHQGLKVYEFYLNDLLRNRAHLLSEKEEKILAETGLFAGSAASINSVFRNAEFPYPEVTLSDGSHLKLDQATFSKARTLPNRQDRELVFDTFFGKMNEFRLTFAAQLDANVKKDLFYARVRGYKNCLEAALDPNAIPIEVYHSLIRNVRANLPSFYRYLDLKRRMLAVDTLRYIDLYAPVVKDLQIEYDIEQAQAMILKALNPLGKEYLEGLQRAFNERWIDVYPTPAKRSGAYSNGSIYDVHPYILLNYNSQYNDVSTLAHELGHTMHSYFSNKTQPYPLADYPIFVAEVASTFNEILLFHDNLKRVTDDNVRLTLLMEYLDGLKGTVFRQTQFADFELKMHEMAERGEQLTGESLNQLYENITREYYGHQKGVCKVDDCIKIEWAYIPHFYYNFYVYQYATAYTAATALAQKVLKGEPDAVANYLRFLSAGGSDYPINLLKKAGVDMTSAEPFELTMQEMNWVMDEIEKVLARRN
jgi:oligoendopeptidase F